MSKFIDPFQEKIWRDKYQYKKESFKGFCERISGNVFRDSEAEYRDRLFNLLYESRVLFGGRTNSNIGVEEKGLTLFNCFIEAVKGGSDSLEGIIELVKNFAVTLKTEGGVGLCANFLRPANTVIRKIGVTTPGSIKFLELFDKTSEIITSGNVDGTTSYQGRPTKKSIRKGATMVTMSICHPDIEEFITAKTVPNRLTKCNMSVLVTDAFMYAVDNDLDWQLWFPDINHEKYDIEWDGNFEAWAEKGYPTVAYKTVKARDLYDLLLKNTYNRNEPGILFIDNIRKMDNLHYLEGASMLATNPCGEVPGSTGEITFKGKKIKLGDVCNLGSINLTKYYDAKAGEFDMDGVMHATETMVRALDNIIEVSDYPLPEYENASKLKRKIGLGVMGVGSLFMMMDVRYGGEESIKILDNILEMIINKAYATSALLAKEKGPFPLYDKKLIQGGFVKNGGVLTNETIELIKKHGLRNSALMAIAPNGTLSIVAGNVSGGLEPVFSKEYFRWNRVEGKAVDFEYPKIHKGEWFETDYLKTDQVGDEEILMSTDGKYRVDKNIGLSKRVTIRDYGYNVAQEVGNTETTGATELTIDEHLAVLASFAKYIDQSCSKTINLPKDISFEDFKELYGRIHTYGVKGCTTYREGSTASILEVTDKKKEKQTIVEQQKAFLDAFKDQDGTTVVAQDVKLPEEYPARGFILRSEGKKWYLHVAFKDLALTRPFAIFVNTNHREDNVSTFTALDELDKLAVSMGLDNGMLGEVKGKYAYQKNPVKICRMLGFLLRHNVRVYHIVKALDNVEEAGPGTFVFRMKKFLSQYIRYSDDMLVCPECGEKTVTMQEGCYICSSCGNSKCS
jgi:ribonucleoside-diphosphate reductase alpha chain